MEDVTIGGVVEIGLGVFIALLAIELLKIVFAKFINKATEHFENI